MNLPSLPQPPRFDPPTPTTELEGTPDKVVVNAYYDERTGACTSMDIRLNYDGISREDITETIRAAFRPYPAGFPDPDPITDGYPSLEVIDGEKQSDVPTERFGAPSGFTFPSQLS